jgi:translocation protein SEC62
MPPRQPFACSCSHARSQFLAPPPPRLLPRCPRRLQRFAEADFYAWTYDRPTSPWVYAAAAAAAVGVFLVCLFPMAPAWTKAGVVYVAASLLAVLSGTLLARALLATATWILAGRAVWLLPNVLQDGIPFKQLFIPLLGVTEELPEGGKREKGKKGAGAGGRAWAAQVPARAGAAVALAAVGWVLYSHAPDRANLRKGASKYRDDIFDMFNIHDGKRLAAGNATAPPPPAADGDGDAAEAAGGGEL